MKAAGEDQDDIPDPIRTDLDGLKDRINDITLGDRDSRYDQMVGTRS